MKLAPQIANASQAREAVKVHIGELVLHGFPPNDRHRIARAVELELARLFNEGSMPDFGTHAAAIDRINAGAFSVKVGAKPQAAGTEIAHQVFRGLQQQARVSVRAERLRLRANARPAQAGSPSETPGRKG